MFNPARLSLARKRRGLNKIRLAELAGISLRSISAFENGEKSPSAENAARLAFVLRFPLGFFAGSELDIPSPHTASFRAMSRMSAAQRDSALGAGALAFLLSDWIEERFELPSVDLLDLREEKPEAAAMALRQHWSLGERPVRNMVHLLEAKGVRIFSLSERTLAVDAFSVWRNEKPFVFLNTLKSAEHSRLDAAHELGHLVLHKHGGPYGQAAEREAHAFASAFLMPKASVLAVAPRVPTLAHLIQLKKQWIVSVAALTYRLHAIGLLSEWHYRTLCIEISERGFRREEPSGAQRETSLILAKVFSALRSEGIGKDEIAAAIQIDPMEIDGLVFGLTLLGLNGGATAQPNSSSRRANLRVIK